MIRTATWIFLWEGEFSRPVFPYPRTAICCVTRERTLNNVTQEAFPEGNAFGMVSTVLWTDYDRDGQVDLLVALEVGALAAVPKPGR